MKRQKNGIWKLTDAEMNLLCTYVWDARDEFEKKGLIALARQAHRTGCEIYDTLEKTGFYKDIQ